MRNYAEELAYWYFRLNGFFPISDFVLHRTPEKYPSDCDIVAVRPPHVYERIGGNSLDWDKRLNKHFDSSRSVGVICEVKGGTNRVDEVLSEPTIKRSLQRLGFVPDGEVDKWTSELNSKEFVDISPSFRVVKVLISNCQASNSTAHQFISIKDVKEFIKQRMVQYTEKQSDWTFFQSSIIQEIIWEVRIGENKSK